jgi:hypothetical protein
LPLMERNNLEIMLFISSVEDLRDHVTPSQGAGFIVPSMGNGKLTHLSFRSPDPTR